MAELGKVETAKIPADQAINGSPVIYPKYEDLTFRANISSDAEGMEGLLCVQALVNAVGLTLIIKIVRALEKSPGILQQGLALLPTVLKL